MLSHDEWAALGLSGLLLLGAGFWHLYGIRAIKWINKRIPLGDNGTVLVAFWGLATLHVSEIVLGAMMYGAAIHWFEFGTLAKGFGDSPAGLLYFSGITFTTLGYSQQDATGALRLMVMMQALAGFMLITWSATYVYTIWGERFREAS
jgi:hypothetical protein